VSFILPLVTILFTLTLGTLLYLGVQPPAWQYALLPLSLVSAALGGTWPGGVRALAIALSTVLLAVLVAGSALQAREHAHTDLPDGLCAMRVVGGARPATDEPSYVVEIAACQSWGQWYARPVRVRLVGLQQSWLMTVGDEVLLLVEPLRMRERQHAWAYDPAAAMFTMGLQGTVRARGEAILVDVSPSWSRVIDMARVRAERLVLTRTWGRERGVILAMLTGSRGELDEGVRQTFASTGAAHVLAVSGMHLVLLCQGLFVLLSQVLTRIPAVVERVGARRAAVLILIPLTIAYVQLTGAPASAVRAGVMMVVMLAAEWFDRPGAGIHALCASVMGMVLWCPWWVFDAGFQLSIGATGALVVHARVYRPRRPIQMPRWKRTAWAVVDSLRVSTVASFGTAPILLWHFGELPLLSPLTNLLIVPALADITMPASAIAVVLDLLHVPGVVLVWWVTQYSAWFSLTCADLLGGLLSWSFVWGRPSLAGLLGWTLLACASPWLMDRRRMTTAALFACSLLLLDLPPRWSPSGELRLHAIPVGQGDCTLVELPDGTALLVDAGGGGRNPAMVGMRSVLPYVRGLGYANVETFIVTHADSDHIGGFSGLWTGLRPSSVQVPTFDLSRLAAMDFLRAAARFDAEWQVASGRTQTTWLGPVAAHWFGTGSQLDENNGGLVMQLCLHTVCALLPGDVEAVREQELVAHYGDRLRSTFMNVPHHGSSTSSTPAFLDAVRPLAATIQLGAHNRFGFPHEQTTQALHERRIRAYRTDQGDAWIFATDGNRWRMQQPVPLRLARSDGLRRWLNDRLRR
jgi:competence protein ComEC